MAHCWFFVVVVDNITDFTDFTYFLSLSPSPLTPVTMHKKFLVLITRNALITQRKNFYKKA